MQDSSLVDDFASLPKSIIAGDIWSPMSNISHIHSELSDPFVEFFRVADRTGMRMETAVKKLVAPARLMNIGKRGLIREGYFADITIMRNGRPDTVLVNGKIAYGDNPVSEVCSGEILTI